MQIACWPPRPGFHPLLPSQTRSLTPPREGGEAAGPPGTPLPPPPPPPPAAAPALPAKAPASRAGRGCPSLSPAPARRPLSGVGHPRPSRREPPQRARREAPLRAAAAGRNVLSPRRETRGGSVRPSRVPSASPQRGGAPEGGPRCGFVFLGAAGAVGSRGGSAAAVKARKPATEPCLGESPRWGEGSKNKHMAAKSPLGEGPRAGWNGCSPRRSCFLCGKVRFHTEIAEHNLGQLCSDNQQVLFQSL